MSPVNMNLRILLCCLVTMRCTYRGCHRMCVALTKLEHITMFPAVHSGTPIVNGHQHYIIQNQYQLYIVHHNINQLLVLSLAKPSAEVRAAEHVCVLVVWHRASESWLRSRAEPQYVKLCSTFYEALQ